MPTNDQEPERPEKLLLDKATVAHMLDVSEATLDHFMSEGELVPINMGTGNKRPRWKFERKEIERFIAQRRSRTWQEPETPYVVEQIV